MYKELPFKMVVSDHVEAFQNIPVDLEEDKKVSGSLH